MTVFYECRHCRRLHEKSALKFSGALYCDGCDDVTEAPQEFVALAEVSRLAAQAQEKPPTLPRDREWLLGAADSLLNGIYARTGRPFNHTDYLDNGECVTCAGVADDLDSLLRGTLAAASSPSETPIRALDDKS